MKKISNSILFNQANPFGKCDINQIKNFEKKFLIKIPNDFREYLYHFNGAKPKNTICKLNENGETSVHHMYGLHKHETYRLKIKKNMLVFADDSFGNEFAINIIDGENYGCIYFIDNELIDTEFDSESIVMINKSFDEFVSSLMAKDMYLDNLKEENPEIYAKIQELKKNPQI